MEKGERRQPALSRLRRVRPYCVEALRSTRDLDDVLLRALRRGKDQAMKIKIEIELGGEWMQTPSDVIHAVDDSVGRGAWKILSAPLADGESGTIKDAHGNEVGSWKVDDLDKWRMGEVKTS